MENMVTVSIDLLAEAFPHDLTDGEDVTDLAPAVGYNGIQPDRLTVDMACGPGGGNPACLASFIDEKAARAWFAFVSDDDDPTWFDANVV